jgi:hypothetical protein
MTLATPRRCSYLFCLSISEKLKNLLVMFISGIADATMPRTGRACFNCCTLHKLSEKHRRHELAQPVQFACIGRALAAWRAYAVGLTGLAGNTGAFGPAPQLGSRLSC